MFTVTLRSTEVHSFNIEFLLFPRHWEREDSETQSLPSERSHSHETLEVKAELAFIKTLWLQYVCLSHCAQHTLPGDTGRNSLGVKQLGLDPRSPTPIQYSSSCSPGHPNLGKPLGKTGVGGCALTWFRGTTPKGATLSRPD